MFETDKQQLDVINRRRTNERRLRFSSDADIVRLTNARIIIVIIINVNQYSVYRIRAVKNP